MEFLDMVAIAGMIGGAWLTWVKIIPAIWKKAQSFFGWEVQTNRIYQSRTRCEEIVALNRKTALENLNRDIAIEKQLKEISGQLSILKENSEEGNISLENLVGCSKDLLRQDFDHIYNVYVPLGYLPENIRDRLIRVYENYESLNGNGTYAEMYKQLILLPPAGRMTEDWEKNWVEKTPPQNKL